MVVYPRVVDVKTRRITPLPGEPVGWSKIGDLLVSGDERLIPLSGDSMTEIGTADATNISYLDWSG